MTFYLHAAEDAEYPRIYLARLLDRRSSPRQDTIVQPGHIFDATSQCTRFGRLKKVNSPSLHP